jgi:hypothetical protein
MWEARVVVAAKGGRLIVWTVVGTHGEIRMPVR